MDREGGAARRTRLTARLLNETCLRTSGSRLALAALLATGTLSTVLPASAVNVATEAELRNAISGAQSTITFTANITLTADLPHVANNVAIDGGNFTLSGNNQFRGLFVESGNVTVNNLTIANAKAQGGDGGGGARGGGGGAGMGGALFIANGANVTLNNVGLQDNLARGGNGAGLAAATAGGGGGGMFGNGTVANAQFPGPGGAGGGGEGGGQSGSGQPGSFGGGGGGSGAFSASSVGGNGGFGGGGGGGNNRALGGFGGGDGAEGSSGGGGGAGLGGAIFVQQGGTITMNGSLSISSNTVAGGNAGPAAQAGHGIGSGLFLQGSGSFAVAPGAGQTQTISDAIADQTGIAGSGGSWSLVKNGAGTTILTGANAYSGGITVNTGTLQGNTSSLRGNIANNAFVVFDQASSGAHAGNISGTGTLTKTGTGVLTLRGGNTYSGGTAVSGGTLQGNTSSLQGNILNNASVVFDQADNGTYAGNMSGTGALTKIGAGVLTLAGDNTYFGGTTVSGGALQGNTSSLRGNIANNAQVIFNQASNGTYAGNMSGNGALFKIGAGELELTGTNTYAGGTQVVGGTLRVGSDDKLGAAGTHIDLQNNGVLRASETFTSTRPVGLLGAGGGFQVDAGKSLNLSGIVSGAGNLAKSGDGTLILAGANSFAGDILINGGTVQGNTGSLRGNIFFDSNPANSSLRSVVFEQPATQGDFLGDIEGDGSLTKIGPGTVTFFGRSSYTGGTTVLAGALVGDSRSLQGAIVNNAAVIFDQQRDGTYAGAMTGSGQLIKTGGRKLTLTGTSAVGGGTTINSGGFAVNGSLTSNVTLNKGGVLSGVGNIHGNITNNGGTIEPGNSIGNITIDGNLTWNGGTFGVEVSPSGTSDRITIVGAGHKVTVHAGTLQVIPQPGTYVPNTKYTIITAPAGGIATFNDITGGVGLLTPVLSFDETNLYLSLILGPNAFRWAGQTVNEQAVGGALDSLAGSGNIAGIVTAMANLPTVQAPTALDQLSGEAHASTASVLADESLYARSAILGRLRQASYGGNTQMAALSVGGPQAFSAEGGEAIESALAYAKSPVVKAPMKAPAPTSDIVFWAQGFGAWGRFNGDGNAATVRRDLAGFFTGVDTSVAGNGRVGIAAGYTGSRNNLDGRGAANVETGHVAGYGGWSFGSFSTAAPPRSATASVFTRTHAAPANGSTAMFANANP